VPPLLLILFSCVAVPSGKGPVQSSDLGESADTGSEVERADSGSADGFEDTTAPFDSGSTDTGTADLDCPDGVICVDSLPFDFMVDTTDSELSEMDAYSCAPDTDESGPEVVFQITLTERSFLGVAIDDSAEGVDIDAHLLADLDPESCIDRGNSDAGEAVDPGVYYVVADTFVSGGVPQSGAATITIGAVPVATGDCTMQTGWIDRVGDGGETLAMPATGRIVLEAHLVDVDDGYGTSASDPWPQTITESILDHYRISQQATGFVMARNQPWAPQEGCEFGQGSGGSKLPTEDEGWYVNMYWSDRPDRGTRMILQDETGRALVVAAGYETGPGNLDWVGGTTEEVHHYMGTGHGSELTLGFAVDQGLPFGPIDCAE
jgi:hypothetical protein